MPRPWAMSRQWVDVNWVPLSWRHTTMTLWSGSGPAGPGGRPCLLEGWGEVAGPAAGGEGPAEDRPVVAVDHRAEVGPAVLAAPDTGHVGLPERFGRDHVERAALRLGMRPASSPGEAPLLRAEVRRPCVVEPAPCRGAIPSTSAHARDRTRLAGLQQSRRVALLPTSDRGRLGLKRVSPRGVEASRMRRSDARDTSEVRPRVS
jgi:hypothetical protein